jgi:hypothetical protein
VTHPAHLELEASVYRVRGPHGINSADLTGSRKPLI